MAAHRRQSRVGGKRLGQPAAPRLTSMLACMHARCVALRAAQIEHHLFPAISFMHYPAISKIVEDECKKRGVVYAHYATLPEITARFMDFMAAVGKAEQKPMDKAKALLVAKL